MRVRLKCEFCKGTQIINDKGCTHCLTGYIMSYDTKRQCLEELIRISKDIIDDADGEDYFFDFVLRLSLLEIEDDTQN